jgi:hypothetical protein
MFIDEETLIRTKEIIGISPMFDYLPTGYILNPDFRTSAFRFVPLGGRGSVVRKPLCLVNSISQTDFCLK